MYQYQVSFGDAVKRAFTNYCCFTGRASRSEYWWFALFAFIINLIINVFGGLTTAKSFLDGEAASPFNIFTVISYLWGLVILYCCPIKIVHGKIAWLDCRYNAVESFFAEVQAR